MRRAGRKNLRTLLLAALLPAALAGCSDDLALGPDPASRDRLPVLEASASNLSLELASFNRPAVAFTWTPGSNHGTNAAVDYTLEIDAAAGTFAAPLRVELGRGVYSQAYTVAALNELLIDSLGIAPGTAATLKVRLKSATPDSTLAPDYSNVVEVTARPYRPVTRTLYLLGSAAPAGWSADAAAPLKRDPQVPFVFTYQGNLKAGELKFITTLGRFQPAYVRATDSTLVYTETDAVDGKFTIAEDGSYIIRVDLAALKISIEKMAGPKYSQLWMIGDATPAGWVIDKAAPMRQDPSDPFVFEYNEVLAAGEFKIATAKNWDAPFYRPVAEGQPLSSTDVQLSTSPDYKWRITEPGAYKITLDTRSMTISIQKFTPYARLWMVGDAAPNGWEINDPTELTRDANDPYVFTYTGPLKVGEFKFPVATGSWETDFFMPAENAPELSDTFVRFVPGGQPDRKWKITEAGSYRITLDQLRETIRIEKL